MTETLENRDEPEDETAEMLEQREFGFWLYLMSDAIIFALLFSTYAVLSATAPSGADGRELFSLTRVSVETALLLLSSLTFGMASVALATGHTSRAFPWLRLTFALGAGFVALEVSEFSGMIAAGAGPDRSGLLSAYFALLGAHGLHVAMGLVWIVILTVQLWLQGPTPQTLSRLMRLGLFWHFLDIVWIGIYSVVYLPAMM